MKKRNLAGLVIAGLMACTIPFAACNGGTAELSYSTGINAEGFYDNELFYRNDLPFQDAPDPGAIYENGYFYTVTTGAPFKCYRTRNFANWEYMPLRPPGTHGLTVTIGHPKLSREKRTESSISTIPRGRGNCPWALPMRT